MSDRIFVKPAPGLTVRKPVGGYLAEAGEEVNRESYWLRRLADGDVLEATPPAEADKATEKAAPKAAK